MSSPSPSWWNLKRPAGFRFSATDGLAILACGVLTATAWKSVGSLAWLFPIVLGHFFLFCNVFRVHRSSELTWAGLFVLNVGLWVSLAQLNWAGILGVQTPFTLLAILRALLSRDYHGVGYSLVRGRRIREADEPDARSEPTKPGAL